MYAPIPDGQVNILRGVPLDSDYKHTIYFASEGAQSAYFAGKQKYSYTSMMYVRETGRIRVPIAADSLFDCNYLMYKNQQYLNKWFYAFINQVYYVNDNCAEIEFQIDVLQTWLFNIDLKPSFIDRQHTQTDVIGENIVPEPLSVSEYHCYTSDGSPGGTDLTFRDFSVVMYAPFSTIDWLYHGGDDNNGIWDGLEKSVIGRVQISPSSFGVSYNWVQSPLPVLQDLYSNHPQLVDQVAAIVMLPTSFITHPAQQKQVTRPTSAFSFVTPFETYTPKCKKVYTFPYTKLEVTDGTGGSRDFAFEDFDVLGGAVQFNIFADQCANMSITCVPDSYRNVHNDTTHSIVLSGFPMCSWVSNAYLDYISSNMTNIAIGTVMGAANGISGAVALASSYGATGGSQYLSGLGEIASTLITGMQAEKRGFIAHGAVNNATFYTIGKKGFEFRTMAARLEELKIIDNFFNQYGYAIHETAIPNLAARPHWTFIKTIDACILPKTDGLPASDLKEICKIFDRGITWWRNGSEVGDYSLDNSV